MLRPLWCVGFGRCILPDGSETDGFILPDKLYLYDKAKGIYVENGPQEQTFSFPPHQGQ